MNPLQKLSLVRSLAVLAAIALPGVLHAQQGYVKTHVDPGRAGVFIDGKYVGPAANFRMARKFAVAPGAHEIKLVEPRYEEVTTNVTVVAGKTVEVKERLKALPKPKPPFGRLRAVTADKFAAVYVNGKFMGHAGEFNNSVQGLLLSPGEYVVKIGPASGSEHEEQGQDRRGPHCYRARPIRPPGRLLLHSCCTPRTLFRRNDTAVLPLHRGRGDGAASSGRGSADHIGAQGV